MEELNKYFLNNNRRHFLKNIGFGIGGLALGSMLDPFNLEDPAMSKLHSGSLPLPACSCSETNSMGWSILLKIGSTVLLFVSFPRKPADIKSVIDWSKEKPAVILWFIFLKLSRVSYWNVAPTVLVDVNVLFIKPYFLILSSDSIALPFWSNKTPLMPMK